MLIKGAKFLSIVLHPLLLPSYGVAFILFFNNYLGYLINPVLKLPLIGLVIVFTFLFPVISAYILKLKGYVHSMEMENPKERGLPFAITASFYIVAYYILQAFHLPHLFNQLLLGSTFTIIAALIINLRWKISIHMIGIGGVLGAMIGMAQGLFIELLWPVIIMVLLSGMLGTARLLLGAHNQLQIYAGFLLGFAAMFILFGF